MKHLYKYFILQALNIFSLSLFAQTTFTMDNITTNLCEGVLLDSENGQLPGHYDNNEDYTFVICVPNAQRIRLTFSSFCTEYLYDTLTVFDGPNISSPRIGTFSGSPAVNPGGMPGTLTATSGCMTLRFVSDGSVTCTGWQAAWEVIVDEPEEPAFLPVANPSCFSNSLTVTLDRPVPCDSVYAGAFSLTGPDAPAVISAAPLNCASGMTSTIRLTFNPSISASGTYSFSFTNYFMDICNDLWELTAEGSFIVNDCPLAAEMVASDETVCPGDCIQLEARATGGNGIYSYTWSHGLPPTAGPHTVCVSANTTYSVTVDDTGPAAAASATKTILMLPLPVITNPSADTTACQNLIIHLTANPPGGTWSGPGLVDDDTQTGRLRVWLGNLGANTYIYTDENTGCTARRNISILQFWDGGWEAACPGSPPFQVRGGIPPGGNWVGPHINSSGLFTPSAPGAFDVTYYAPNGCFGTKRVNVDSIVMQENDTVCSSWQPYYEPAFSPLGGVWTGAGIINDFWGHFDPRSAGTGLHTLTYTIAGGCTATLDLFVQDIFAGWDTDACPLQSPFTLPAGNPPGGTWSGIGIINAATGLYDPRVAGGNFDDVLIYTAAGCTDTLTVYVRQTDIYTDTVRLCEYASGVKLDFAEPWSGIWSGPGVTVAPYPGYFDPAVAGAGVHTIYYTANSCTDSMVFVVIQTPVINPVIGLCVNSAPINLTASPAGGVWVHYQGNGITDPLAGTFDPQIAGIGMHAIIYATLPDTCFSVYLLRVDTLAVPSLGGLDNFYCHKDTAIILDGYPDGGIFSGNGVVDSFFNPAAAGAGFHKITYTYGAGDCAVKDEVMVMVGDAITAASNFSDTTICNGDFVNISVTADGGTGEYVFSWSNGLPDGQFQTVTPSAPATYIVTVSDGCSDSETLSINVRVHPEIRVSYVTNPPLCYGETGFANLTVLPADTYSYRWNTSPVSTTKNLTAPVSRTYTVNITSNTTGCSVSEDIELPGYSKLSARFAQNPGEGCITLQNPFFEFIDLSEGVSSGLWNFGDGETANYSYGVNPTHQYADTGKYVVTLYARNEGNCLDTFSLEVCVEQHPVLFIPNSFTPNGDNVNDYFSIQTFGLTYFEMYIYNRWGEELWRTTDPEQAWDGTHRGEYVPMGGYAYVIYYMGAKSRAKEVKKGMIVVVR